MKTTLIISTYNWPEALELVLLSVKKQVVLPDEVVIADDGSKEATKALITAFKKDFPVPLIHVWHEDKGFRRSAVLNLAVSKTKAEYIIQLDGDCIIHKNFIKDHINAVEKDTYLFGSRVNIKAFALESIYANKKVSFSYLAKEISKRNRNIYIPFLGVALYKRKNELSKKLRGCNLSFWKADFIKVNGYNEDMTGWGREDSELIARMLNNGLYGKRLKFKAIVYHIWHKNTSKAHVNINDEIQTKTIEEKLTWCSNGIDKYLKF